MPEIRFDQSAYPVRADIEAAERRAWQRLGEPGMWWTAAERIAIAAEARQATGCRLCRDRRDALSPRQVQGEHESLGRLAQPAVEAIHAIRTDPGRLTRDWHDRLIGEDLSEEQYVELVGVVATTVVVDTFHHALGLPVPALPKVADAGVPQRNRPAGARRDRHWVPTLAPEDVGPGDIDPYADNRGANIHRALSLVPQEVVGFFDLAHTHYLSGSEMLDLGNEPRAIDRAQIELLAARVSALNQCVY